MKDNITNVVGLLVELKKTLTECITITNSCKDSYNRIISSTLSLFQYESPSEIS